MSKRETLNKLNVNSLRKLATEYGIDVSKKKKEDLIQELLIFQTSASVLTPIVQQDSAVGSLTLPFQDSLPPFNAVVYDSPDHCCIPKITFGDIYSFLIERPSPYGGTVKNFKGLDRAVKHFEAGDVQDIKVSQINSSILYIRDKCQASMKKHHYQVYICISRNGQSGTSIHHGYCQCPVGLGQSCSHIGSLLFALSHAKPQESCTSMPCKWVVPTARSNKHNGPLETLSRRKSKEDKTDSDTNDTETTSFDPRHTTHRDFDLNATLLQLRNLKEICQSTGMSHLWNIPDDVPIAEKEIKVETYEDPLETASKALILSKENYIKHFLVQSSGV